MTNSRRKGKTGELELVHTLKEMGYAVRRGQQYSGANGDADITGMDRIHIECKRVERLNIHEAMGQAVSDAREEEIPVVMHRRSRTAWLATLPLKDFCQMYDVWKDSVKGEVEDGHGMDKSQQADSGSLAVGR